MKRLTASKKSTAKPHAVKAWLKNSRTMRLAELWETIKAKLRGRFSYYGITDNFPCIKRFKFEVVQLLFKWLNRRGKRGCIDWERISEMLELFPLPEPRIMVNVFRPLQITV
ncbi:maturase [bacterium]|nr:maturase [bacterium]